MAYGTLVPRRGLLGGMESLHPGRKGEAEGFGDHFVDTEWALWDRASWSGDNVPPTVELAWRLSAESEYLRLEAAVANLGGAVPDGSTSALARARELAMRSRDNGFVVAADGFRLLPEQGRGIVFQGVR